MAVRHPRVWLVVNGTKLNVIDCDISVHRHQSADTFHAHLALDAPGGRNDVFWAGQTDVKVEVHGTNGDGGSGDTMLLKGQIDQVEILFETRIVQVSGRDRTAELTDKKSKEKFQDQTSSAIVNQIANRHGLTVSEDATQDKAGKQYVYQHDRISDLESEWSVIVALAEREGKVAYIKGDTLYFVTPGNTDASGGTYAVHYQPPTPLGHAIGNFVRLRAMRNLTVSKQVKATVRSFDRRQKKAITSTKTMSGSGSGTAAEYEYRIGGLSQEEADAIASKKVEENSKFEKNIEVDMPGDVTVDPRMMLQLTGTGTAFDQNYFIDSIEHRFHHADGYQMHINAKNKDPKRTKS